MGEYGTGFKLSIHNEEEVTIDDLVKEAQCMWGKARTEFKNNKISINNESLVTDFSEKLMARMRKEHNNFCQSYPIVLRYMCEMREFNPKAFRRYLMKLEKHPWKTEEEYLDSQADYVVMLYQATHPRWNKTDVNRLKTNIRNLLQSEHKQFKQNYDNILKDVESTEEHLREKSKAELAEFFNQVKSGSAKLMTGFTVEMDSIPRSKCVNVDELLREVESDAPFDQSSKLFNLE
jgi:hypothetical protein